MIEHVIRKRVAEKQILENNYSELTFTVPEHCLCPAAKYGVGGQCSIPNCLLRLSPLRPPHFSRMAQEQRARVGLYEPLPQRLGGTNARPSSVSLGSILPFPRGANIPAEDALNARVRNRALLLDSDSKVKKADTKLKSRKKGRAAAGKVVIPKAEQKYELYVPLMQLWTDYASKLIKDENVTNYGDRVLRMDLHGAPVHVVRSRDPGLVGIKGILVAETANTIIVVTEKDRALTVPKNVAVIRIEFGKIALEISLPALQFRASERAARKIKKRHLPAL